MSNISGQSSVSCAGLVLAAAYRGERSDAATPAITPSPTTSTVTVDRTDHR